MLTPTSSREGYPDECFSYTGAISSKHAIIGPSGPDAKEYYVFDAWHPILLGGSMPCVGFVPARTLAPIIFQEWRQ